MSLIIGGKTQDSTLEIQLSDTASVSIKERFSPVTERKFNSAIFRMNKVASWLGLAANRTEVKEPSDEDYTNFHEAVVEFLLEVLVDWEGVEETAEVKGETKRRKAVINEENIRAVFSDFSIAYVLLNKLGDRYVNAFMRLDESEKKR